MEKICGIYKITSPSGKIYIGQSINCNARKGNYKCHHAPEQVKIHNSIKKYSWASHKFEVIHECSPEQLNELEVYYIELYDSTNIKTGLNIQKGGSHSPHTKETCLKISNSKKGKKRPKEFCKKFSELRKNTPLTDRQKDTLIKMYEKRKGIKLSPTYIIHIKKQEKLVINPSLIQYKLFRGGYKLSLETRRKMSESFKRNRSEKQKKHLSKLHYCKRKYITIGKDTLHIEAWEHKLHIDIRTLKKHINNNTIIDFIKKKNP